MWTIVYTDEFENWWEKLNQEEKISITSGILVLQQAGPTLRFPYSSAIKGSKHSHMRELRIQHKGSRPFRVLYAFDPTRQVVLLTGGDKTGANNWYKKFIRIADKSYEEHLKTLKNSTEETVKN